MPFAASAPPVLEIDDVSFVRAGRRILDRISLTIREGERWAMLGLNGSGKSTLLSLCGAMAHPTSGTVTVLGRQLGRVDIRELRQSIGHVNPRHPLHAALTIEEVVLTGVTGTIELMSRWTPTAAERSRALELIDLLGLGGKAQSRWTTLSQGERGRALIARALLPEPRLLLLDEPSTGLDVAARERLLVTLDVLHAAQPRLASLLVTHHLEELPTSTTHATLMLAGTLEATGPASDVLTTELVSACFEYPITVSRNGERWVAHAAEAS